MGLTQVSTDGVKNDAITKTKIPANQIEASELADNAVDTNAIQDQAVDLTKLPHGTGSNDGKFLRANNGADPTFETVTSTTINGNTDHRVITATGTANTLQGESGLTYNGSSLGVSGSVAMTGGSLSLDGHPLVGTANFTDISGGSYAARLGSTGSSTIRSTQIYGGGSHIATFDGVNNRLGIGITNPNTTLEFLAPSVNSSTVSATNCKQLGQWIQAGSMSNTSGDIQTGIAFAEGFSGLYSIDGGAGATQHLGFFTGAAAAVSERMRIDSSGNVGIGTGSNAIQANLHVEASVPVIRMKDSDNNSAVQFVGQDGSVRYDADNDNIAANSHHAFNTDNVERVRIQAEGLTFNGDTAAANALDDYEQGTYTAHFNVEGQNNMSMSGRVGVYVKVGQMVTVMGGGTTSGVSGAGTGTAIMFTNLPFPVINTSSSFGHPFPVKLYNLDSSGLSSMSGSQPYHFMGRLFTDATSGRIEGEQAGGAQNAVNSALCLSSNSEIQYMFTYRTDA